MTATNVRVQMQLRRDTAAGWTSANPTLLSGEMGYETDTRKFKVGDGTTAWSALAYNPGLSITAYPLATADIADNAITTAKIPDNAITTAKIPDNAITSAKILNGIIHDADINASAGIAGTKIDPDFGNQTITTTGTISTTGTITTTGIIEADGTGTFGGILRLVSGAYVGTASNTKRLDDSSNGSSSATLFIGNASIQVSSDARLKENIEATNLDAISAIKKINVKDFTWNDPSDTSFNNRNARGKWTGLIAQELVEILPFIVNAPRKESDGLIDHDSKETWTLDQSQLCPVLIKAMQQQQEIISALEQRLTDAGL